MELLPRDVNSIIHRYVFDYYYGNLRAEYKWKWWYNWDDVEQSFKDDNNYYIANWRELNDDYSDLGIYAFGTYKRTATLPQIY